MKSIDSPQWFNEALELKPSVQSLKVDGVNINYLAWGEKNKPGILFVHGGMAHAHWWSCLLYTSPSPRDMRRSRMPSSA